MMQQNLINNAFSITCFQRHCRSSILLNSNGLLWKKLPTLVFSSLIANLLQFKTFCNVPNKLLPDWSSEEDILTSAKRFFYEQNVQYASGRYHEET